MLSADDAKAMRKRHWRADLSEGTGDYCHICRDTNGDVMPWPCDAIRALDALRDAEALAAEYHGVACRNGRLAMSEIDGRAAAEAENRNERAVWSRMMERLTSNSTYALHEIEPAIDRAIADARRADAAICREHESTWRHRNSDRSTGAGDCAREIEALLQESA